MENVNEKKALFKKYLKKVVQVVENDAVFTLGDNKIVNAKRIDDVLCCIESNWPDEYKKYVEMYGTNKLQTPNLYANLSNGLRNKFIFTSYRLIDLAQVRSDATKILSTIESDLTFIYQDKPGKF